MNYIKLGSILALAGGCLGIVIGIVYIILGSFEDEALSSVFNYVFGGYFIVTGIVVIIGSFLMKHEKTQFAGSLVVMIFGVAGGGTMIAMAGGLLGLLS